MWLSVIQSPFSPWLRLTTSEMQPEAYQIHLHSLPGKTHPHASYKTSIQLFIGRVSEGRHGCAHGRLVLLFLTAHRLRFSFEFSIPYQHRKQRSKQTQFIRGNTDRYTHVYVQCLLFWQLLRADITSQVPQPIHCHTKPTRTSTRQTHLGPSSSSTT